jgi:serine/threonine protein kinase
MQRTLSPPDTGPQTTDADPVVGLLVGQRYRIRAELGRGGMGVVYAAMHELTHREVAVKFVQCGWGDNTAELHQRFMGEARIPSRVKHPNVVDVLDMGFHGERPYMVLEMLRGESLEAALQRARVLSPAQALSLMLPVMAALEVLHGQGIAHRDIKPSNIFLSLTDAGRVVPKVLDFGLARVVADARLTRSGMLFGTPYYLAPERAAGHDNGPSADVWAVAVVLYECLCGQLPFRTTDLSAVAVQLMVGDLVPARTAQPALPPAIAAVLDRALQRDPAIRYADMGQLAYAMVQAALLSGIQLPRQPELVGLDCVAALLAQPSQDAQAVSQFPGAQNSSPIATEPPLPSGALPSTRRPRALLVAAFMLVSALVLLLGAIVASKRGQARTAERVPPLPSLVAGQPAPAAGLEAPALAVPPRAEPAAPPESSPLPPAIEPARKPDKRKPATTRRSVETTGAKPPSEPAPHAPAGKSGAELETSWE